MEKLSGLVLDYYDDFEGDVLQTIASSQESVKVAYPLTPEERDQLPDDVFALVALDHDVALKKFAVIDRGNTQLSVDYFVRTGHLLPKEAQQVAAANLLEACRWYNLSPPDSLEKVALGLGTLMTLGLTVPGAAGEAKKNVKAIKGAGGTVMTPDQIKATRYQMGV